MRIYCSRYSKTAILISTTRTGKWLYKDFPLLEIDGVVSLGNTGVYSSNDVPILPDLICFLIDSTSLCVRVLLYCSVSISFPRLTL